MPPESQARSTAEAGHSLSERRWAAFNWVAAAVLGAWSAVTLRGSGGGPFPQGLPAFHLRHVQLAHVSWLLLLACVVLASLPIGLRRRWPLPVLAVVTGATVVLTVGGRSPLGVGILLALAGYTVVTQKSRRLALRGLVVAEVALGGALAVGLAAFGAGAFGVLIPLAVAWFVGDSVAARRAYLAAEAEQARQRGVIEAQRARQTLRDERMAIARELHDVVAHGLTVIAVQAGVGRRLTGRQPDQAEATLRTIEETARTAQEELRVVLELLRDGDTLSADLTPAPGLSDLEGLAETLRAAGTSGRAAQHGKRSTPLTRARAYRLSHRPGEPHQCGEARPRSAGDGGASRHGRGRQRSGRRRWRYPA